MNDRATAFLVRSLRQESRYISHHVVRVGMASVILILFAANVVSYSVRAGAGSQFASKVMNCCYWFVTLLGGIYFSTAIVEEKEEQTLPLLKMTGASSFTILLGKSGPRLVSVLLLLLVVAPFLMLAATLGGVLQQGILTAFLGIFIYSIMLCQLGLLASVLSSDSQRAFSKMLLAWLMIELAAWWSWLLAMGTQYGGNFKNTEAAQQYLSTTIMNKDTIGRLAMSWLHMQFQWLYEVSTPRTLFDNLSMYLFSFRTMEFWQPQMTFHLILAIVFFACSWALFEPCTAQAVGEGPDSGKKVTRRQRKSKRAWRQALVWKSWQHITGGHLWFWMRLVGMPAIITAVILISAWAIDEPVEEEVLAGILMFSGVVIFIANFATLLGRVFNNEIHQQTLPSLLMLPKSRNALCGQMVLGLAPAILASAACFVCGFTLMVRATMHLSNGGMMNVFREPWFYNVFFWIAATMYFGLYLSIRLRYGGMLLAILAMWVVGPTIVISGLTVLSIGLSGSAMRDFFENVLPVFLAMLEVVFCAWMHFTIIRSLNSVAEQG
ncbi:hypothetical protein [Fuerstiella marisgermanici]|uniref:ABC-2 family transporter protein n=1 Tax=Fuerstiella marisgermanici TaxID=1891926 RepID=A0A1P8WKW3_9PLAN|nr:hypothetical protein [Fuerstiella marisgermanici]APZ94683.1 hypothetical protein Fuma_04322 [Fuerstiella marisgermanici]